KDSPTEAVWIQHETGLEFLVELDTLELSTVADVLGIFSFLYLVYEHIRERIVANNEENQKGVVNPPKRYKVAERIRIEIRREDSEGKLSQKLAYDREISEEIKPDTIEENEWIN
ncbi:MAG: hypothetical protein AAB288_04835, partial [Acidobacteriota bacterium]